MNSETIVVLSIFNVLMLLGAYIFFSFLWHRIMFGVLVKKDREEKEDKLSVFFEKYKINWIINAVAVFFMFKVFNEVTLRTIQDTNIKLVDQISIINLLLLSCIIALMFINIEKIGMFKNKDKRSGYFG